MYRQLIYNNARKAISNNSGEKPAFLTCISEEMNFQKQK
jgi:hypothetical protein